MKNKYQPNWLLLILTFLTIGCSNQVQINLPEDSAIETSSSNINFELGNFKKISGSSFLVAPIRSISNEGRSTIRISSSGGGYVYTHNYIYLDLEDETLQRLLPVDDHVIQDTTGHAPRNTEVDNDPEAEDAISWWVYSIVKDDSNEDGYLGADDLITIGVADVGGQNFTEILEGIEEILGQEMKNDSELVIIFVKDGLRFISKINMLEKTIVDTQEIFVFASEIDQ